MNDKSFSPFAIRFSIGAILGAIAYILIVRMTINQTDFGCYQTGWARSVIEGTMFFAWIVIEFAVPPESPLYEPAIQGLSSVPFAILGGFIVSGLRKEMLYTLGLLIMYVCLALFLWAFFMAAICA